MDFIPVCEPTLIGNELKYVEDAVKTSWISSNGKYVQAFETEFAKYCGVKYAVGVCNGTVALHLALTCLGIGKGDEVIIPNFTMIATAFAVCYTGAIPVFVDSDEKTWNIDVERIEEKITKKTKAIIPVHIFGLPCEMDKINTVAKKYNLKLIEDAAEAHGAVYQGKKTGSLSDISAFSFYANKNITTGEGGMIVTDSRELYEKALYYKNLCFDPKSPRNYSHNHIGFNYRMSNLHAAIGLAQTERADEYKTLRIKNGKLYRGYLKDVAGITFQVEPENIENVYWMNGITVDKEYGKSRDKLIAFLKKKGIDSRVFFAGMNKQKSLKDYGADCTGHYPVSEYLNNHGFYLPSGSNLKEEQIRYICDKIIEFKTK